jgi:hypothetical protein
MYYYYCCCVCVCVMSNIYMTAHVSKKARCGISTNYSIHPMSVKHYATELTMYHIQQ